MGSIWNQSIRHSIWLLRENLQVSGMRELINDPFYELIEKYDRCIIDYCLIEDDKPYQGKSSHKDAIQFTMLKVLERDDDTQLIAKSRYSGEAQGHQIDSAELLHVPEILRTDRTGRRCYDCDLPDHLKGEQIPYWYAFWETPHISGYGPDEFRKVNEVLFPNGTDELEVYEWTTDWSDYFDDGHEWWGAACWSVYDKSMNRYVVIMASTTD